MRPIFRLSLILLALFLAIAPAMTLAQVAGSSTTTTTTGPATTGGSATAPNGSSSTTDKTTTTDGSSTTTTTTGNVPWVWIVVGAIVIVGIIGIVAASNRSNTTRIVS